MNVMIFGSSEGQTEKKRHSNKWDSKMSKQNLGLYHLGGVFFFEIKNQNKE